MALQLGNLRDALRDAGASEASARNAAEEVTYEKRLVAIERQIGQLRACLELGFEDLEGRVSLLTWMVGLVIPLQATACIKLFIHG